jgi:two-component system, OmpR family, KDP operon response regulator KdpE
LDVPLIALLGRHTEAHLVAAFDSGVDDYLEKPFRVAELLVRIRSLLRRGLIIKARAEEAIYHCEGLFVDVLERSVTRGGKIDQIKAHGI